VPERGPYPVRRLRGCPFPAPVFIAATAAGASLVGPQMREALIGREDRLRSSRPLRRSPCPHAGRAP
jgi:hypothetical protein